MLLIDKGFRVVGTTRKIENVFNLRKLGIEPIVVDVFDAVSIADAVSRAEPDVVIHQLTDLSSLAGSSPSMETRIRNARIRDEGTANLVAAAARAKVDRFIAQSVAFAYASNETPHSENDPLAIYDEGGAGISARGVASLENHVLTGPFIGVVLRYGTIYGPGTNFRSPPGRGSVHVEAAARAAYVAIDRGEAGIYNIAEDDGTFIVAKAKAQLGWTA